MKTLPVALLALTMISLPLTLGCWRCESGPEWERYANRSTAVTIDAGAPSLVPITVSAPAGGLATDSIAIELGTNDCSAGSFTLGARLLRTDGTAIAARDGAFLMGPRPDGLACPTTSVVFEVPTSELTCTASRCTASFSAELTSSTGVGPRQIEARLVDDVCSGSVRRDAAIDAWGN